MSDNIQYRFQLYDNGLLKETSGWYPELYAAEMSTFSYLACNPMNKSNELYLVSNEEKKALYPSYYENKYKVVKIIYGSMYKNTANCYILGNNNNNFIETFENTMLFSEDELIYKYALWISKNKHLFKKVDEKYLNNFDYTTNEFINSKFQLKKLFFLGLNPDAIPWSHIDSQPDINDWIKENFSGDINWFYNFQSNVLNLPDMAKSLKMLDIKFNNLMNHFDLWNIFN